MRRRQSLSGPCRAALVAVALAAAAGYQAAGQQVAPASPPPVHAKPVPRLLIRNAMVVYGNAKPAFGPVDVLVEGGLITRVGRLPSGSPPPDAVIDATGKYVLPGLINSHMHLQDERGGIPQPLQYEMNLYLASGVTTVRDVGSDWAKSKAWRAQSNAHTLIAPRMLVYSRIWASKGMAPDTIREGVAFAQAEGVDGLKLSGMDRDQVEAVLGEAGRRGLKTAVHIAVEETTATDFAELGVTSIEHFYGVADAAFDGIQDFPPDHNSSNEVHRFGRAGELYTQRNLNRDKLSKVLDLMIRNKVAWCPTFSIYEASRDVIRAQNLPWYREFLHPAMEEYFKPSLANHGSYFLGWTNTQEVRWKRNYRVWMDAVREFANRGGLVTAGDDAGFIYSLYGFGFVRELELLEEAGFHPLEVISHATANGAKLLGMENRLGRVREGYIADLIVVHGNPLSNLRLLTPGGADVHVDNKSVRGGGIEWTIKDGIPYHVPTLLKETRELVAQARAARRKPAGP